MAFSTSLIYLLLAPAVASYPSFNKLARNYGGSITDCLKNHDVPFAISSSSNWAYLQTPFNLRLPYTPDVITLPTTPEEVSDSVLCAAQADVKVQAKSGGHSYASFSSGGKNGSAIVDLENFNTVELDTGTCIPV